jgi:hypothetical protein
MRDGRDNMNEFEKFKEAIRFDMKRKPVRQRHYLRPVTWLLSYPTTIKRKLKIYKKNMEGVLTF